MKHPTSFLSSSPSIHPSQQVVRVVEVPALPRSIPTLTVYADGLVNLNGEAARALGKTLAVTLAAPGAPGGTWLLLPVPPDHPGALLLYSANQGGGRRFRAVALATAVFALLPSTQRSLVFRMDVAGTMFRLVVG